MNRLASTTSPYLRQHADNPVDWFPWGEEAFARARELDRPLLVSIGYSSCHWCHVMAHECFEDEAIAAAMNADFVAVKVDREERPDVDAIYMEALQALTGGGGWPLNIFVTPSGEPFFGGTYFPPQDHAGRPGFPTVLEAIAAAWRDRRSEIEQQAGELTRHVSARLDPPQTAGALPRARTLVAEATARFSELYDPEWGGVGSAPKFPQAPMLELLLRAHLSGEDSALEMATTTLLAMASGGIYDQLAGGFARYSVDRYWRVPHFEKMLYDQAVLARCYLHAYQVTGDERLLQVVRETCRFVLGELAADGGGLCSSFDADSPGGEGAFYTWTPAELEAVLGAELGAAAAAFWGVSEQGNFEHGRSVLEVSARGALLRPPEIERARGVLDQARRARPAPARDEKILTEWNALMAATLAEIAAATDDSDLAAAACTTVDFLLEKLRRPDGRLLRSYMGGVAEHLATAADYAALIDACCRVAECTGRARYLDAASELADDLLARFVAAGGGLYLTGADAARLVLRPTDRYDGVIPGATSQAVGALVRLGALLGRTELTSAARGLIERSAEALAAGPLALAHLLTVYLTMEEGQLEVVLAGARPDLLHAVRRRWRPNVVLAWGEPMATPLWEGRDDDRAYVCRDLYCLAPVDDADELAETLDRLALAKR